MGANLSHQLMLRESGAVSHKVFQSHLYRERLQMSKNLYKVDLQGHYGCVNAIEFSIDGKYLASGGDDKRVLIWDVETAIAALASPRILHTEHTSNIFCLGLDRYNRRVLSGGNDDVVIEHDFQTGKLCNVYKHDNPVYGLSIDPQCNFVFATACEDGQILLFDQRADTADPLVLAQQRNPFHGVQFHPDGHFLATANSKYGVAFWDVRKPLVPVIQYGYVKDPCSCMSVRFNTAGNLILALRRRMPPILYNTNSPMPIATFYHDNYYNSCTMKSCTFAGQDDEYVISGSDDFNLYVWRLADVDLDSRDQWVETTQMVLYGHRSIVNQVRYNREKCLLASSGVEKIVKLWSPFSQRGWTGSLLEEATRAENPRKLYVAYNYPANSSWSMSHDYSTQNTSEDPRMMAFFDALIQQELESWDNNNTSENGVENNSSLDETSDNGSNNVIEETVENVTNNAVISDVARHNSANSITNNADTDVSSNVSETASSSTNNASNSLASNGSNSAARSTEGRVHRLHMQIRRAHSVRQERRRQADLGSVKYVNHIDVLIAKKRNSLRRLALRGATYDDYLPSQIENRLERGRRLRVNHFGPNCISLSNFQFIRTNPLSSKNTLTSDNILSKENGIPSSFKRPHCRSPTPELNSGVPSTSTGISTGKRVKYPFHSLEKTPTTEDNVPMALRNPILFTQGGTIASTFPQQPTTATCAESPAGPNSEQLMLLQPSTSNAMDADLPSSSAANSSSLKTSMSTGEASQQAEAEEKRQEPNKQQQHNETPTPQMICDGSYGCDDARDGSEDDFTPPNGQMETPQKFESTCSEQSSESLWLQQHQQQQSQLLFTPDSGISVTRSTPMTTEAETEADTDLQSDQNHTPDASNGGSGEQPISFNSILKGSLARERQRNYRKRITYDSESD